MSRIGAALRAAVPVSHARAEASRQNGAKSRGPRTPEGRARSARNALKHGMRAQKHLVLPDEDAAEFAALVAALVAELAPVGALQTVLARRVAVAAWRLARADRLAAENGVGAPSPDGKGVGAPFPNQSGDAQPGGQQAELFEERRSADGGLGLALIRDGNGPRSFETLLRYRGAATPEFWRALRTRKALQAEQAAMELQEAVPVPVGPAPARGAATARRSRSTERTRAHPGPAICPERAAHARRPARARRALAAERTRERCCARCVGAARECRPAAVRHAQRPPSPGVAPAGLASGARCPQDRSRSGDR